MKTLFNNMRDIGDIIDINGGKWEIIDINAWWKQMTLERLEENERGELVKTGIKMKVY